MHYCSVVLLLPLHGWGGQLRLQPPRVHPSRTSHGHQEEGGQKVLCTSCVGVSPRINLCVIFTSPFPLPTQRNISSHASPCRSGTMTFSILMKVREENVKKKEFRERAAVLVLRGILGIHFSSPSPFPCTLDTNLCAMPEPAKVPPRLFPGTAARGGWRGREGKGSEAGGPEDNEVMVACVQPGEGSQGARCELKREA